MALLWILVISLGGRILSPSQESTSSGSCQSSESKTRAYIGSVLTHDEWIVCVSSLAKLYSAQQRTLCQRHLLADLCNNNAEKKRRLHKLA